MNRAPLFLSLLGLAAVFCIGPAAASTIALPLDDGGTTEGLLLGDLVSGELLLVDRPDRDPLSLAYERKDRNLFTEIGRPTGQAARPGDLHLGPVRGNDGTTRDAILVEGSTGFLAFYEKAGKGGRLGELTTAIGRPFEAIASPDGNFSLLMHRNASGRTVGAWLYHATTGRAVYYPGLEDLVPDSRSLEIGGLPEIPAAHAAVPVFDPDGSTVAFLVFDPSTGAIHRLSTSGGSSSRLTAIQLEPNLWTVFDSASGWRRFRAVGLEGEDRTTRRVLVIDPADGKAAFLDGTGAGATLTLTPADLAAAFEGDADPEPIARHERGRTTGVWLLESGDRRGFYLSAGDLALRPVRFTRP